MEKSDSSACLTAERFTGADQLQVIEAAGDAAIAVRVECVQRDAGAAIDTEYTSERVSTELRSAIHNAGCRSRVCIDERRWHKPDRPGALRHRHGGRFDGSKRRYALGVALELGLTFGIGGFIGSLDLK